MFRRQVEHLHYPRFIIVDREGFIANPDALRPSFDSIDDILLALCCTDG